jgi:hypothetical protein
MILQCHDPAHQHSKWISLLQLPKINEVNLEPLSIMETSNWFSASLGRLGDRILLEANNTSLAVMLDKLLGDIVVLVLAIDLGSFLAQMCLTLMPIIYGIENLLHSHHNSSWDHLSLSVLLHPPKNCTRFCSRRINHLKMILLHELGTIGILEAKC